MSSPLFLPFLLFLLYSVSLSKVLASSELNLYPQTRQLNPKPAMDMLDISQSSSICTVSPYESPFSSTINFPPFDPDAASVYRYRQQQSVNLGSWFVLEQWMVPSLFKCAAGSQISELDVASGWGSTSNARALLERHWDTFMTQEDFNYLSKIGINTVRLPIGYWSLGPAFCQGTAFEAVANVYQNSWNKVIRAIDMAGQAGIGVLVDLHGAVGSQNGQPHSGTSDHVARLFGNSTNVEKTYQVLKNLTQRLASVNNVVGIQILNEPVNVDSLTEFYTDAINRMRATLPEGFDFPLYIHDAFDLQRFNSYVENRTDFVVVDHHSYFVFSPTDASEPASQHTQDVKTVVPLQLTSSLDNYRHNLVVGEWSCALTPQSLEGEIDPGEATSKFCMAQLDTYTRNTPGWSFWCKFESSQVDLANFLEAFKKEDCDEAWCFRAAVDKKLPSTFFSYGNRSATSDQIQKISELKPDDSSILSVRDYPFLDRREHDFKTLYRHRTRSIFERRQTNLNDQGMNDATDYLVSTQPLQVKAYLDGFATALKFALNNGSKLGFIGQYISDISEAIYQQGFVEGLRDGEYKISQLFSSS